MTSAKPDQRAASLLDALRSAADPEKYPNRHYKGQGGVLGVRMGELFDIAKKHTALPLSEVELLLAETEYEPRLAAFCVLDFQVRSPRLTDDEREARYRFYLDHHGHIDTWDMVDRAAPRVIGRYLHDRPRDPLFELAASDDPYRRRTAMTAPLGFLGDGAEAVADTLRLAEALAHDRDPIVSKPVGIALKHAGAVAPAQVQAFLDRMGDALPAPVRREARSKLPPR
ncbi:MAG: DNA alkylation repair protein [Gordonia sp. (in: high G+C Gram-positive bacteria)]